MNGDHYYWIGTVTSERCHDICPTRKWSESPSSSRRPCTSASPSSYCRTTGPKTRTEVAVGPRELGQCPRFRDRVGPLTVATPASLPRISPRARPASTRGASKVRRPDRHAPNRERPGERSILSRERDPRSASTSGRDQRIGVSRGIPGSRRSHHVFFRRSESRCDASTRRRTGTFARNTGNVIGIGPRRALTGA